MRRRLITDRREFEGSPWDPPVREFLPMAEQDRAVAVRCTRLAGSTALGDPHDNGGGAVVELRYVDGHLEPFEQFLAFHRSRGFEFGYSGSGPAALAANILGLLLPPREAWRLHQDCKAVFVARVPRDGGEIAMETVRRWVEAYWATERSDPTLMQQEAELRELAERYGEADDEAFTDVDDADRSAERTVEVRCAQCGGTAVTELPAVLDGQFLRAIPELVHTPESCPAWRTAVLRWSDGRTLVVERDAPGRAR